MKIREKVRRNRKTTKAKHEPMEEKHLWSRYQIRTKGRIVYTHTHSLAVEMGIQALSLAKMQCFIVLQCSKRQRQWYISHKNTHRARLFFVRLRSSWNWLKLKGRTVCLCHLQMVWYGTAGNASWPTVFCVSLFIML